MSDQLRPSRAPLGAGADFPTSACLCSRKRPAARGAGPPAEVWQHPPGAGVGARARVLPSVLRRSASAESSSDGGVRSGSRCCGISWPESEDGTHCPPRPEPPSRPGPPKGPTPLAQGAHRPHPGGTSGQRLTLPMAAASNISGRVCGSARSWSSTVTPKAVSRHWIATARAKGGSAECTPRGGGAGAGLARGVRHACWQRHHAARGPGLAWALLSGPGHALQPCEQQVWAKTLSPPRGGDIKALCGVTTLGLPSEEGGG